MSFVGRVLSGYEEGWTEVLELGGLRVKVAERIQFDPVDTHGSPSHTRNPWQRLVETIVSGG